MYYLRLADFNLHVKLESTSCRGKPELVRFMILWCALTRLKIKQVNLLMELNCIAKIDDIGLILFSLDFFKSYLTHMHGCHVKLLFCLFLSSS